jgi:photosystem II stability/assembly factor-like uncharacterized protein
MPTDERIRTSNPGALLFHRDEIVIGTQREGVFSTRDRGKTWIQKNAGLRNLTVRKLAEIDQKLYVATNAGLYSYEEPVDTWKLEYGNSTMQVNGITEFDGVICIGTNQGAFSSLKGSNEWKPILANRTLHNISADDTTIYAMVYNELFSSVDKGQSWQSIQRGLPAQLYTFNVIRKGNSVFAGQWDGVYRKDKASEIWKTYSHGLPKKLAITNMTIYRGSLVVSGSERGLKAGMTTDN